MRIAIIGAGRLATCLAPALQTAGNDIVQVWSRTENAAVTLATALGCEAAWGNLETVTHSVEMYLICVKDDAIADVAARLHERHVDAILVHTSGATSIDVLTANGHKRCGVVWPIQTFTSGRTIDFSTVHFCIEATDATTGCIIEQMTSLLTDVTHIHRVTSNERQRLHLAAVFVSNFVNHCCALAEQQMKPTGLAFDIMQPLLEETVAKLRAMRPADAQTGPAIRWDKASLQRHHNMLAATPRTQDIYDLLSESIHQLKIESYDKL